MQVSLPVTSTFWVETSYTSLSCCLVCGHGRLQLSGLFSRHSVFSPQGICSWYGVWFLRCHGSFFEAFGLASVSYAGQGSGQATLFVAFTSCRIEVLQVLPSLGWQMPVVGALRLLLYTLEPLGLSVFGVLEGSSRLVCEKSLCKSSLRDVRPYCHGVLYCLRQLLCRQLLGRCTR